MQLYPILLVGVLLAWDGGMRLGVDFLQLDGGAVAAIAWAPVFAVLGLTQLGLLSCRRRLTAGAPQAVIVADRLVRAARWVLLANHAVVVFVFGWLGTVRSVTGDLVLVDEVVAVTPTVAGLVGLWWVYYPIEMRVREAVLIRRLDEGQSIFPRPSRGGYVLAQARLHLLFLLVPILLIVCSAELINRAAGGFPESAWAPFAAEAGTLVAALGVVAIAPLVSRFVLDVEPLPAGPLHDDLTALCRVHGVKVRRLLLWHTQGSMINAAVMGLMGGLRYVLLTDALLEAMNRPQLHAVMAHEIGHISRRHMPWLIATLMALILLPAVILEAPMRFSGVDLDGSGLSSPWFGLPAAGALLALVFGVFGWVSRRFERQADTFAACHLSLAAEPDERRVTPEAAATVAGALGAIARMEPVRTRRPSWRHGSIAWRQAYLASIVGRPVDRLEIDRQVRRIKLAALAGLALAACYFVVSAVLVVPAATGSAA